ncbi:MAG: topoisomerase IV, partial [Oscillospiraceae bacterium]|nr:topoisomerase IV [Oscillospiraceae bacterium]
MKHPKCDILELMPAPDFPLGAELLYDKEQMREIYETGRGSFKMRAVYEYDKENNCIEIKEIPYSTTVEAILSKVMELVKANKLKEISDARDETGLNGFKLTFDLKRGTDPDALMLKLYKLTPLEDSFACNFNILIDNIPKVLGVREIIGEWVNFRMGCIKNALKFDIDKKSEKLHLLTGLKKILMDIDKAIKIVRETEEESDVVPNLMLGFGIDQIQAEYVADIKLRHLNREYILNRLKDIENLENSIAEMEDILADKKKIRKIIITELKNVSKKYGTPRNTMFFYKNDIVEPDTEEETPDYPVNIFLSESGYFKKITPQSLRMSGEQKLKDGDRMTVHIETTNKAELLFFTDKCQVYKAKASMFDDTKASVLGDFVPVKLGFDEGENLINMTVTDEKFEGYMLYFFRNGKVAKVPLSAYQTKTNRKKLANAYSSKQELCAVMHITEDVNIMIKSSAGKALAFNSALLTPKSTRDTIGVQVMTLRGDAVIEEAVIMNEEETAKFKKYISAKIPAAGITSKNLMDLSQMKL